MKLKTVVFAATGVALVALLATLGYLVWKRKQAKLAGQRPTQSAPASPEQESPSINGGGRYRKADPANETGRPLPGNAGAIAVSSDAQAVNGAIPRAPAGAGEPEPQPAAATLQAPAERGYKRHMANPLVSGTPANTALPFEISHLHNRAKNNGSGDISSRVIGSVSSTVNGIRDAGNHGRASVLDGLPPEAADLIPDGVKDALAGVSPDTRAQVIAQMGYGRQTGAAAQAAASQPVATGRRTARAAQVAAPTPYYLHPGRLIEVQLINTLESFAPNSPVLGLVVHDVRSMSGEVVIPAGSHIVGYTSGHNRDRIFCQNNYRVILTSGEFAGRSLPITAATMTAQNSFMLNKQGDAEMVFFGPNDMKVGLCGYIIRPKGWTEAGVFGAAFLKKFTETRMDTNTNALTGQQAPTNSLKNAGLSGTTGVIDKYADGLAKEMEDISPYVLVPGGNTSFYLFLNQPADIQVSSVPLAQDPRTVEAVEKATAKESSRNNSINNLIANPLGELQALQQKVSAMRGQ